MTQTSTTTTAEPSSVRLVEGPREILNEGFVDILHNGVYGTICNDNFDDVDAKVICGMLGFKYALKIFHRLFTKYDVDLPFLKDQLFIGTHFKSTEQFKMSLVFFDHVELTLI